MGLHNYCLGDQTGDNGQRLATIRYLERQSQTNLVFITSTSLRVNRNSYIQWENCQLRYSFSKLRTITD